MVSVGPATPADEAKHQQYAHDFANDINRTDGDPLEMLQRWTDRPVKACVVDVDEMFDQTPGPSARIPRLTRRRTIEMSVVPR